MSTTLSLESSSVSEERQLQLSEQSDQSQSSAIPLSDEEKAAKKKARLARVASTFFKDKALREFPSYLRLMQLPKRDFPDIKVGRLFNLPSSVYHQFWLSFTFGFANCNSFRSFGIFASLMTGNMVLLSINIKEAHNSNASFICICVLSFFVFGTVASNLIIEWVKDRYHSFALIYLYVCIFISIVEGLEIGYFHDHPTQHSVIVCFLIGGMGMLCHWCYKMNYQVVLHIGNVQKVLEYAYNKMFGYKVGGKRGIGDIVLCSIILLGFVCGCLGALVTRIRHSLFPLLVLFPVHLYTSGTLDYWRDLRAQYAAGDGITRQTGVTIGLGDTVSPMQPGADLENNRNLDNPVCNSSNGSMSESSNSFSSTSGKYNPFAYQEDLGMPQQSAPSPGACYRDQQLRMSTDSSRSGISNGGESL